MSSDAAEPGGTEGGRLGRLREAAIAAEYATGRQEPTPQRARRNVLVRLAIIVVGWVVLIAGLVMMVLPGPGIVAILAGLGILSRELPWAERLMEAVREKAKLDELKEQPAWVRGLMWALTIVAVAASVAYLIWR